MKFRLHVRMDAIEDYSKVARRYDKERSGLGTEFLNELQACYHSILDHPGGFQYRTGPYRHAQLKRFPYRVVYQVEGTDIYVYQVRHTSRKPSSRFGP